MCNNCNNGCSNNCSRCPFVVRTTAVTLANNILTLTLPEQTYYNNAIYCIVIAQSLPEGVTSSTRLNVVIGGTTIALITPCGHHVYADQVACRRRIKIRVAADALNFVVISGIGCTHNFFPEIVSITPAPAVAVRSVKESAK